MVANAFVAFGIYLRLTVVPCPSFYMTILECLFFRFLWKGSPGQKAHRLPTTPAGTAQDPVADDAYACIEAAISAEIPKR